MSAARHELSTGVETEPHSWREAKTREGQGAEGHAPSPVASLYSTLVADAEGTFSTQIVGETR